MRKIALLAFGLLLASPAYAADNTLLVTPCASGCITTKSKDIGAGVQAPQPVISDTGGNPLSTPTAGANAVSNTATGLQVYARPSWFNGVTWDAALGDATNGAFVNVKTSVLPTGAATSAAQTTAQTSLSSIVTSTGASATAANQTSELTKLDTVIANTGAAIPTQAPTVSIGGVGIKDSAGTNTATVKAASTAPANTDTALVATLNGLGGPAPYPTGATPITASATGTTGATTATLAGTAGKTTYICGYSIRANATAATTVTNTITGVITATLSSIMWVAPAASGIGLDEMVFSPCIPASATNTGIAIVSGAPGTGGLVSSKGWGYQL